MFLRESIWNIWNISCLRAYQIYFDESRKVMSLSLGSEGSAAVAIKSAHIPVRDRVLRSVLLHVWLKSWDSKTLPCSLRIIRCQCLSQVAFSKSIMLARSFASQSLQIQSKLTFTQTVRSVQRSGYTIKPGTSTKDLIIYRATSWGS
jgi:hypothetical protein